MEKILINFIIASFLFGTISSCKKSINTPSKSSLYGKFWYRDKKNYPMGFMVFQLSSYTHIDDTGSCWTNLDNYDDWRIKEKTGKVYKDTLCVLVDGKWSSIYSPGRILYFVEKNDSLFCIYKETSVYTGDPTIPIWYDTCFMGKRIP